MGFERGPGGRHGLRAARGNGGHDEPGELLQGQLQAHPADFRGHELRGARRYQCALRWVGFDGRPSWDVFAEILEKCDLVTTPGSGFGPGGEGFVRVSAFGHREYVEEACKRLQKVYGKVEA